MKELRTEIEFDGTPEETWAVLTDLQAYPEWNPFIEKIDGELRVGARVDVRLQPLTSAGSPCTRRCSPPSPAGSSDGSGTC
jgi:uncharacterized protein YndB with AHSA1/START domain